MTFISLFALTALVIGAMVYLIAPACVARESGGPGGSTGRFGRKARGFTLVEMLVAVAVLAILVVMLATMMSDASLTVRNSNKHLTADDQARLVLDRLQMDFARMLKRNDVYFQFTNQGGNNDLFTFYSETPGFFASGTSTANESNLSLVSYQFDQVNNSYVLERLGQGYQWTDIAFSPTTQPANINDNDYHILSNSVFRMQVAFLERVTDTPPTLQITSTAPTPGSQAFQNLKAVMVAIAVLDPNSQELMNVSAYPSLIAALPQYTGSQTITLSTTSAPTAGIIDPIVSAWESAINASNFAQIAGVSKAVAQQVRIYQRIIYLQ